MNLPAGPQLPALLQTLSIIADPTGFLARCADRYGDPFTLRVLGAGSPPVVFFSQPDAVQAIFTTLASQFELGKITHVFRPLTGSQSLIMQDGSRHQQQRQLLMPAMHGDRLHRCGQVICDLAAAGTAHWADGAAIAPQAAMLDVSLEIILRVVFGVEPGQRYQQLRALLHDLMEAINSPLYSVQFFLPPLQQDLGARSPWGSFVRQRQQIDDLLYAEIEDRRRTNNDHRSDVLSLLLAVRDEAGEPLSTAELRDQLMTLLLLGHETTASGLAWAFYWLCRQPQVLDRLQRELDGAGTHPDPMTLAQLPYLTAVCKEALRVYPIALIAQPRVVRQTVSLSGCEFAPGTVVVPCIYLAHRRAQSYPNPDQFQPDRFLGGKLSPYEYFPFGGGSRSCIGMALAMFEMKLVLATVLRRYVLAGQQIGDRVRPVRRGITFVPPQAFRLRVVGMRDRALTAPSGSR